MSCFVVYGWLFILPLWGMAAYPAPGFSPSWTKVWLIGTAALFLFGWGISRGANMQKYTFKRWPDRRFLGFMEPEYIEAGDRKILCSGLWGVARHFKLPGRGVPCSGHSPGIRLLHQSVGLDLLRLHRLAVHLPST